MEKAQTTMEYKTVYKTPTTKTKAKAKKKKALNKEFLTLFSAPYIPERCINAPKVKRVFVCPSSGITSGFCS